MKPNQWVRSLFSILMVVSSFSCRPYLDVEGNSSNKEVDPSSADHLTLSVPCEGNSWVLNNSSATERMVVAGGIKHWGKADDVIRTYFYAGKTGPIELGLRAKFDTPTSLDIKLGKRVQKINFSPSNQFKNHYIGRFNIDEIGYHFIELRGISKVGSNYGEVSHILFDQSWTTSLTYLDKDWFYWGRRGPSVHLSYETPPGKEVLWFYNEVTIPEGKDPVGSFFMANGFSEGYFGMQVNSPTERRILFSVWSAYSTDDPNQIPSEYRVTNLGNGEGVTVQNFGNEGSGKQSFKLFNWKAGTTYKFLVKGEPAGNNSTDFTAYFYAPELREWQLIASLRRPHTSKYLTGIHSFLENFVTSTGDANRKGNYNNQWVYTRDGNWYELTSATFTFDATANSRVRLDYGGGVDEEGFYLENCGFFNENINKHAIFERRAAGLAPSINFAALESP